MVLCRQTLSDNSALVGMSRLFESPVEGQHRCKRLPWLQCNAEVYRRLNFSCSQASAIVCVCVVTCASSAVHRSHPLSDSCLAQIPNLPDLPGINLSSVIKCCPIRFAKMYFDTHTHTQENFLCRFVSLVDF